MLDGVGIGAAPDASEYGDHEANTLKHCADSVGGLSLPNLESLGLGNIESVEAIRSSNNPIGCFGRMLGKSAGKDSTTGHWEIAGLITESAFPVYPKGFPSDLMSTFLKVTGCNGFLGNKPASGTEIIQELGRQHLETGFPIVYTSGDSVFQIACHEDVVPLSELYSMCEKTRARVTVGEHSVGRVIARPFLGTVGAFKRTANRKDYSIDPPNATMLDVLISNGVETVSIGKIDDLFNGRGLLRKIHTKSNEEGVDAILDEISNGSGNFVMANLVDFDMMYGHRQDPIGFARALEEFDRRLPDILNSLGDNDLLMITADHGNDPADSSTDHTREYVPLLTYSKKGKKNQNIGTRETFADAGKTVLEFLNINSSDLAGTSFLSMVN